MRKLSAILMPVAAAAVAACSSSVGVRGESQMRLSLASTHGGPTASPMLSATRPGVSGASAPDTIRSGSDVLIITSAQLVLRKIKLESASALEEGGEQCDDDVQVGATAGPVSAGATANACAEVELGPVLFDVPLGGGVQKQVTVNVPPGTFEEVTFKIHKPTGSSDAAFLAANPTFDGVSVRVAGTFNGTPFTFTSDLTAKVDVEFGKPITFTATTPHDVTIQIDLAAWFRASGGGVIDPATANAGQPNEATVEQNIRASFHAFEDDNHDGVED